MTHRTHVRISDMSLGRYTALRNHKRRRVSKKWDRVMVVRPANATSTPTSSCCKCAKYSP